MPNGDARRLQDRENIRWVQTRMMLDEQLMHAVRHGFSLIAVGFGSFAFLEGVVVLLAMRHNRSMMAWVNADEFPDGEAPDLPDQELPERLGFVAVAMGVCSFIGLLLLR